MFSWYAINTYSGHENKVKQNLEHRIVSMNQKTAIRRIVIPTETVTEMKDNQKVEKEVRTMPGYLLVNMELNEDSWGVVKGTPGVTGFVGSQTDPVPLAQSEIDRLLANANVQAAAAGGGRRRSGGAPGGARARPVQHRRDGQGRQRSAVRLLRRDRRNQRRRAQAQGARLDLRSRDPGRGRLRPGQEGFVGVLPTRKGSKQV